MMLVERELAAQSQLKDDGYRFAQFVIAIGYFLGSQWVGMR
ncbi:MAG: hypothetical protein ACI9ND_001814 [Yoonia sp.]|jgi:hypothetical protein